MEIRGSVRVKWDLGLNVSGTHLRDGGAVEWPLNCGTALFTWSLIDGPAARTHWLPRHGNKSLNGVLPPRCRTEDTARHRKLTQTLLMNKMASEEFDISQSGFFLPFAPV